MGSAAEVGRAGGGTGRGLVGRGEGGSATLLVSKAGRGEVGEDNGS